MDSGFPSVTPLRDVRKCVESSCSFLSAQLLRSKASAKAHFDASKHVTQFTYQGIDLQLLKQEKNRIIVIIGIIIYYNMFRCQHVFSFHFNLPSALPFERLVKLRSKATISAAESAPSSAARTTRFNVTSSQDTHLITLLQHLHSLLSS